VEIMAAEAVVDRYCGVCCVSNSKRLHLCLAGVVISVLS
jgi:hypothetical protein